MDETFPISKRGRWSINRKLVPLKFLIFILYGGMAALYPYLTIHMKSLGLTITETAIIYAALPILCCVGPAVTGALADKLGHYKIILVSAIIVNILLHTLLYFGVPLYSVAEVPVFNTTRDISLSLPCAVQSSGGMNNSRSLLYSPENPEICELWTSNATTESLSTLQSSLCSTDCETDLNRKICFQGLDNSSCFHADEVLKAWEDSPNQTSGKMLHFLYAQCPNKSAQFCVVNCTLTEPVSISCLQRVETGNRQMTFWLYFVFRVIASIALAAIFPLMDAATIQMSELHHGNIGVQRMYSLIGMCVVSPFAGLLIDKMNMGYAPAFYLYDIFHFFAAICSGVIALNIKLPAENICRNVGSLMKNPRVAVFVLVVFFIGAAWGLIDSFLFWFMEEELGSPKWLLGLTQTVGGISGIPVMACATRIIKRFGHTNILIFSMFVYGLRYIGYSYVYNPYWVLPMEILEAVTNSLMWITATIYASKIAPDYLATLQGIIGGMHYGIGRGAGALIGGLLIRSVGARVAWRIWALVCFASGTVYGVTHFFWLRKLPMPGHEKTTRYLDAKDDRKGLAYSLNPQEIRLMTEEEEHMQELAMLDVLKAASGAGRTGSMVNLSGPSSAVGNRGPSSSSDDEEEFVAYEKTKTTR